MNHFNFRVSIALLFLCSSFGLGCDRTKSPSADSNQAPGPQAHPDAKANDPHDEHSPHQAQGDSEHPPDAHHHHHEGMQMPAGKPLSGASIFHIESKWTTQAGKDIKLTEFSGKPVVLAMVYTHCENACPRIVADMKAIEKSLTEAERGKIRFVLASIDPERDSVERLSSFADQASLRAPAWTLLRADEGAVRELAAVLGVQYRPEPPGDFAHSNIITVLDGGGTIRHQQEGLGTEPGATILALKKLLPPQ